MLKDYTLEQYVAELHSDTHVGGGSAAALNAAIASALVGMVANLTKDKAKYADVSDEMQRIVEQTNQLKAVFIAFIDQDANAFNGVLKAFKMPKNTEEEKTLRRQAIEEGYKEAIAVPLALAKSASELYDLIADVAEKGNKGLVSDAYTAAICLRGAILSALMNVDINLKAVKDEAYVKRISAEVKRLRVLANQRESEILAIK